MTSPYVPSTGPLVVHNVEYVEEATPGTFPTNPTMLWVGSDVVYDDSSDEKAIKKGNIGSEDILYGLPGPDEYAVTLDYAPQNSTFAKYLVNSQGGGTGSIDKSLSLLISPKVNAVANYLEILGAKPESGSIKWSYGKETRVNVKLTSMSIPAYVTTDPTGTGSHASDPATAPYTFIDPGANGVTFNSNAYDFQDITVNFNRNTKRLGVVGQQHAKYIQPVNRAITGSFTVLLEDTAIFSDVLNLTKATFTLPLKSTTSVLTLTNAFFEKLGKQIKFNDVIYEKVDFSAMSASLT